MLMSCSLSRFVGCVCALAALSGCSTSEKNAATTVAGPGNYYAVTASSTAFFRYGPQQGNGPDMSLPKDTLLTVLRPSFGYYKVQLTSGEQGYVASEDVGVAPATLIAAANTPEPEASPQATPIGERFRLDSEDPRLVPPSEPLPQPGALEAPTP